MLHEKRKKQLCIKLIILCVKLKIEQCIGELTKHRKLRRKKSNNSQQVVKTYGHFLQTRVFSFLSSLQPLRKSLTSVVYTGRPQDWLYGLKTTRQTTIGRFMFTRRSHDDKTRRLQDNIITIRQVRDDWKTTTGWLQDASPVQECQGLLLRLWRHIPRRTLAATLTHHDRQLSLFIHRLPSLPPPWPSALTERGKSIRKRATEERVTEEKGVTWGKVKKKRNWKSQQETIKVFGKNRKKWTEERYDEIRTGKEKATR